MGKLFFLVLLVLVVALSHQVAAGYGDQNDQEDGGGANPMDPATIRVSLGVPYEPGREADQYSFRYSPEPLADPQQSDMNRLLRLYRVGGLRSVPLKRLSETANRQALVEMDDPYTNVLGFNKWGAGARLEGSDNHLSTKKADPLPLNGARKPPNANFRLLARKKKSRCVADDSRGVKNPSFCDMDAYFGAAGYRSDLWDSAGRR